MEHLAGGPRAEELFLSSSSSFCPCGPDPQSKSLCQVGHGVVDARHIDAARIPQVAQRIWAREQDAGSPYVFRLGRIGVVAAAAALDCSEEGDVQDFVSHAVDEEVLDQEKAPAGQEGGG